MNSGFSIKQILTVIVVLGIFTFVMISTNSNAFTDNSNVYYDQVETMVIHNARIYANTLDNLKEEGSLVITLDDLVKAGYYEADDEDGNVHNPLNSNGTLNGMKIKLVYQEDGNIDVSIIEEE